MNDAKLIGDIVTHWHKFGEQRTVAFAVNVAHSLHLRDEFVRSEVRRAPRRPDSEGRTRRYPGPAVVGRD
jgi:hypothetical protein